MTAFNPLTGEHDQAVIHMVMEHIETPLRTLVALEFTLTERLETDDAKAIAVASMEEGVAELVVSTVALLAAAWEQAGVPLGIAGGSPPPEVDKWVDSLLAHAFIHAQLQWNLLRIDYAVNVGPLPTPTTGGKS